MKSATPWMKFYPQDWRADEKLRLCSLAARGLWIEMLAIMHRSERYGQLLISGRVPTDAQLAVQVGASPEQVSSLMAELDGAGVFSRAASGAIYSRRMTRDYKKAEIARKNGKNGGNPKLCKQKENTASDKGKVKPNLKLRDQMPDSVSNETGVPPPDLVKVVFDHGVHLLTDQGHSDRDARKIIGKWRKDCRDDKLVRDALVEAASRNISNLVEWVPKYLVNKPANPLDVLLEQSDRFARRAA